VDYEDYLSSPPNLVLSNRLKTIAWVVTAVVLVTVGGMRQIKLPLPDGVSLAFLPAVHAVLNSLVALLLVVALVLVKRRNIAGHRRATSAAMACSVLFLVGYVAYHITNEHTSFGGEGPIRYLYYTLLATHIVLAAISLPFILYTWIYGATNQFAAHRRLAKWIYPIWLYVAVSGPICYLMLRPYYA
jgi:putative membrane protein